MFHSLNVRSSFLGKNFFSSLPSLANPEAHSSLSHTVYLMEQAASSISL
jgi:hypothetical protein